MAHPGVGDLTAAWATVSRHLRPRARAVSLGNALVERSRPGPTRSRALGRPSARRRRGGRRAAGNPPRPRLGGPALGLDAVAVVPEDAPAAKIARTRALGARVLRHGDSFAAAFAHATVLARTEGWRFLHPFDDPDVIAGQSTVGRELWGHAPEVVLVPVGGGGLAAGVALAFAGTGTRVLGVRPMSGWGRSQTGPGGPPRTERRDFDASTGCSASRGRVRAAVQALYHRDEGAGAVASRLRQAPGGRRVAVVSGGGSMYGLWCVEPGHRAGLAARPPRARAPTSPADSPAASAPGRRRARPPARWSPRRLRPRPVVLAVGA